MPAYPGFVGGSNQTQSLAFDCEDAVNLYVEQAQSGGAKARSALYSTPGFAIWTPTSFTGDVGGRGLLFANGRFFSLQGGSFVEYDANGTPTVRGVVVQDANPGQMVFNGVVGGHVLIASGGNGYNFVLGTNTFTAVGALAGVTTQIFYVDGFFGAFNKLTGRTQLSALNDGTTWPGNFFQRSKFADPAQAVFVDENGLIWTIGTESFEVRYNSGVGTQPFIPLSGLVGPYGIASSFAFAVVAGSPYWVAQLREGAGELVRLGSGGVEAVSNYAFANATSTYARTSRIDDAEIVGYQDNGHTFVNVTFPSAKKTWSLDVETRAAHRRGRWNPVVGDYDVWAPRAHAYAFGKHLIVDRSTGQISQMDASLATELDGSGIRRLRVAPALNQEYERIPYDSLVLIADVGVGLAAGQGSDPQALLRVSDDGGRTWGNERRAGLGRMGQYRRRIYWNRLGASADRAFELVISDPVPVRIVNAFINPTDEELQRAA